MARLNHLFESLLQVRTRHFAIKKKAPAKPSRTSISGNHRRSLPPTRCLLPPASCLDRAVAWIIANPRTGNQGANIVSRAGRGFSKPV